MGNQRLDYASRKISEAFARANERRAKQQQEQQEIQSVQEKIQQKLLIMADLKAQIEVFKNADSAVTKTGKVTTNIITQLDRDEQYRTTIIQLMVNHIKSKRNPA